MFSQMGKGRLPIFERWPRYAYLHDKWRQKVRLVVPAGVTDTALAVPAFPFSESDPHVRRDMALVERRSSLSLLDPVR